MHPEGVIKLAAGLRAFACETLVVNNVFRPVAHCAILLVPISVVYLNGGGVHAVLELSTARCTDTTGIVRQELLMLLQQQFRTSSPQALTTQLASWLQVMLVRLLLVWEGCCDHAVCTLESMLRQIFERQSTL